MHWSELNFSEKDNFFYLQGQPFLGPFRNALPFHAPGLAPVCDDKGWFHIRTDGSPLYERRFFRVFGFYEERASVISEEGWYHINTMGKRVYEKSFKWCGNFQKGACTVQEKDGLFFHISTDGSPLYIDRYLYAGDFYGNSACVLKQNHGVTHIDKQGNLIHGKFYRELGVYHKGFAIAEDEIGWFHIDLKGKPIYDYRFKRVEPFYNGWAYVVKFDDTKIRISESLEIELII